jgi:hypothetical protein
MSRSNPRSWNQLLKGDITKGQHKLIPFMTTVRNILVNYEQLNQAIIDYIKELTDEDTLKRLSQLPPELLQRVVYDNDAYNKIMISKQ